MTDQKIPRAATFKVLTDEEWEPYKKAIEKTTMKADRTQQTKLFVDPEDYDTHIAITLTSLLLSLVGCYGIVMGALFNNGITSEIYPLVAFFSIFIIQGLLTVGYELGINPIYIWGWLE